MSDHSFQLFRSDPPCIAEIDFMMQALVRNIQSIPLALHILVHKCDSSWLIIIGSDVHTLNAFALVIGKKLSLGEIGFLFLCGFRDRPFKIFLCNEIRKSNDGDPFEIFLMGVINAVRAILPPKALQRRPT